MRKMIQCEEIICDMCKAKRILRSDELLPTGWKAMLPFSKKEDVVHVCQLCAAKIDSVTDFLGIPVPTIQCLDSTVR